MAIPESGIDAAKNRLKRVVATLNSTRTRMYLKKRAAEGESPTIQLRQGISTGEDQRWENGSLDDT
jgi:hypothetical protein